VTPYPVLVWAHIVLFVYWLGADLGVLIGAIWAKDATRSFAERAVLLQIAVAIDLTPRLAFVLMTALGLTLARRWGLPIGDVVLAAIWAVALVWLIAVVIMARSHGSKLGRALARIQFWFLLIAGAAFAGLGTYLLADGTIVPAWLGWKIILFGGVFFAAIGIDLAFRPVGPAFGRLAAEGSTPEVEAAIRRPIDISLGVVLTLYALLLAISFLGTVKPG
jgi:hypothetical protein